MSPTDGDADGGVDDSSTDSDRDGSSTDSDRDGSPVDGDRDGSSTDSDRDGSSTDSDRDGGLSERARRDIEAFLDEWRVEADVPGASVAVLDREGILYAAGLGARDIGAKAPATPDTLYPAASVTKWVTATAVLQLVDSGDLALEDPIGEYVPYWTDAPGDPITVGDLLSHSSGMPADYAGEREFLFADSPPTSPLVTLEDIRRHVNGASDRRIVDEDRFMYSSRGYLVLGELVEAVDGRSYAELVEAEILDPLGMADSTVGHGPLAEREDAITGYTIEDGRPEATAHDLDAVVVGPESAGGLLASVTDLARFVRCLLCDGELEGARVLDEDLVAAMCSHQAPERQTIDGTRLGCGYGPRVADFLGETVVWHSGTAPGVSRTYAGLLPDRGLGVTLGVNTPGVPIAAIGQGVLALAAGETPTEVVPTLALRRKARAVAGTYEGYRGQLTVSVEPAEAGPGLELSYEDGPDWQLTALPESTAHDDYTFYVVRRNGLRAPLTFHETDEGMELRFNVDRLRRTGG